MQTRRTIWFKRLGLALRTALAFLVVGLTTMYGPEPLKHFTSFPAFSYLTTIMILSSDNDPTLGGVLRSCVSVTCASSQTVVISLVSLRVIGPERLSSDLAAAAAVALGSFAMALPKSTSLLTKRIASGQIVIIYVALVVYGGKTAHAVMHPVHVVASTALGAFASLLAMLVPYPKLAHCEMKKTCRMYDENASERLNLFVAALIARDNTAAHALIAQAGSLSATARKLLHSINNLREGMIWERPDTRFLRQKHLDPGEKLQGMEFLIRGMELALGACGSFPFGQNHEELKRCLQLSTTQVVLGSSIHPGSGSALESKEGCTEKPQWHFKVGSMSPADLPLCFLWYCVELLRVRDDLISVTQNIKCINKAKTGDETHPENQGSFKARRDWSRLFVRMARERLIFALKCSISLGLAVLFGLMYNKENGYWSGLTIAISFVTGRQATFTVANARLQGTAMGSVYGLLCCFIFHKVEEFRFLSLLPWVVFTIFLRHSRMYGQAGGISAVIGALLILGRKNYGAPTEFAIARLVEASIGLLCFIFMEILLNPARAATLAETELSNCLDALSDCIRCLVLCTEQRNKTASGITELRKKQANLKSHLEALEKFITEASIEPNFWFRPFNSTCYSTLLCSLSKTADLCLCLCYELENLFRVQQTLGFAWEELHDHMTHDLRVFKEKLDSSVKCYEEFLVTNSLTTLGKGLHKKKICHDIEARTPSNSNSKTGSSASQEDKERFLSSFLLLLKEASDKICGSKTDEVLKSQTALCLSSIGFCISKLMQETVEIKTGIAELVTT